MRTQVYISDTLDKKIALCVAGGSCKWFHPTNARGRPSAASNRIEQRARKTIAREWSRACNPSSRWICGDNNLLRRKRKVKANSPSRMHP